MEARYVRFMCRVTKEEGNNVEICLAGRGGITDANDVHYYTAKEMNDGAHYG